MTNMIVKLICAIICSLTLMHSMKIMLDKEYDLPMKKKIVLLIL